VLLGLDGFTALTALGGSIALVTGLERKRFPVEWLRGTPFRNYTGPGVVLAGVVGAPAAVACACLLCRPRLGMRVSIVAGSLLMGWVVGEVLMLRAPESRSWLEPGYFGVGLLMAVFGMFGLRRRRYPSAANDATGA
jgi:hypothetical protein